MVTRSCNCGKTSKMYQCNQKDIVSCTEQCDKFLNCGVHRCDKKCHTGDCETCIEEVEQMCHCTRDKRTVACTLENNKSLKFSCGRVCNSILQCKNHKCKEICHVGECGNCKLLPASVKTCPCGKMPIQKEQRKICKDPVPVCDKSCGKKLTCGQPSNPHSCSSKSPAQIFILNSSQHWIQTNNSLFQANVIRGNVHHVISKRALNVGAVIWIK